MGTRTVHKNHCSQSPGSGLSLELSHSPSLLAPLLGALCKGRCKWQGNGPKHTLRTNGRDQPPRSPLRKFPTKTGCY